MPQCISAVGYGSLSVSFFSDIVPHHFWHCQEPPHQLLQSADNAVHILDAIADLLLQGISLSRRILADGVVIPLQVADELSKLIQQPLEDVLMLLRLTII